MIRLREDGADVSVSTMLNDMLRDAKLTSRVTILDMSAGGD